MFADTAKVQIVWKLEAAMFARTIYFITLLLFSFFWERTECAPSMYSKYDFCSETNIPVPKAIFLFLMKYFDCKQRDFKRCDYAKWPCRDK